MAYILGIEIGGTKLQLAVGDGQKSRLMVCERYEVDRTQGAAGILQTIQTAGRLLVDRYNVSRIGVGFGGPVYMGTVVRSHQVPGWEAFPLEAWCRETLQRPTVVGNDCDVAALAESHWGAGSGKRVVMYVTVGTGIGGGLVVDGQLFGQGRPAVMEIGHLRPMEPSPWEDRQLWTVEGLASGLGIVDTVKRFVLEPIHPHTRAARDRVGLRRWEDDLEVIRTKLLGQADPDRAISARDVAHWAQQDNQVARAALDLAIETLGWAVAQAIMLVAPEVVVVGGGVSLLGEKLFFEPLRRAVQRFGFAPLQSSYELLPAALGESVVVIGAIHLAATKLEPRPSA